MQTINHRRLVQEVYDKGVLHRLVGVKPAAGPSPQPSSAKYPETAGVAAVWEAADDSESLPSESDSTATRQKRPRKRKHSRQEATNDRDAADEDESRYAIVRDGAGPPAKRRRTGQAADAHTVFTTDEDEEYALADDTGDTSGSAEEGEVDEKAARTGGAGERSSRERRSYWLSKGVGPPADSD
jgi:non-canonical poly(A) RNA polymerase PAPD5/7